MSARSAAGRASSTRRRRRSASCRRACAESIRSPSRAGAPSSGAGGGLRWRNRTEAARCLEFVILTACRTSEAVGANWEEFDLDAGVWTVPATQIKTGREHRVPLAPPALALVKAQARMKQGLHVFAGGKRGKPLSTNALLALLKRMGQQDITAHGFRSTFRDWAAERTNFPREVAELALAHAIGDKVEAAYRRGDLFDKRARMMADWAKFCGTVTKPGAVVPMRRA
jgi:integrase